jgi:alpha-L-arabinofuranosidase
MDTDAVSATASRSDNSIQTTIINRHLHQSSNVKIFCDAARENVRATILTADKSNATNSADFPERVKPVELRVMRDGDAWMVELPPHSLATIVWQ